MSRCGSETGETPPSNCAAEALSKEAGGRQYTQRACVRRAPKPVAPAAPGARFGHTGLVGRPGGRQRGAPGASSSSKWPPRSPPVKEAPLANM